MEMMEAMRACEPGGYVARKAYPNRKYYKDFNGIFMDAARVDYIDFVSTDWENHPANFRNAEPFVHPKGIGQDRKRGNRSCPTKRAGTD